MAVPTSRQTHIDYCLRRLGDPVIEINVDDDQLEDRVDESLEYFREYHSEALQRTFLKHLVTATDVTNEFIYGVNSSIELYLSNFIYITDSPNIPTGKGAFT